MSSFSRPPRVAPTERSANGPCGLLGRESAGALPTIAREDLSGRATRAGLVLPVTVLIISLLLVPGAFAQSAKTQLKDPLLATRFNEISDRLVCQCGCNMILRVCNHVNCPSAVPMRHSIETQLLAGAPDDSIVAGFVGEYGLKVLSSPPTSGLNLAAWVMPGFALLAGLFAALYLAMRWSAKRRLAAAAPATTIDPELQRRIEDEMKSV